MNCCWIANTILMFGTRLAKISLFQPNLFLYHIRLILNVLVISVEIDKINITQEDTIAIKLYYEQKILKLPKEKAINFKVYKTKTKKQYLLVL